MDQIQEDGNLPFVKNCIATLTGSKPNQGWFYGPKPATLVKDQQVLLDFSVISYL